MEECLSRFVIVPVTDGRVPVTDGRVVEAEADAFLGWHGPRGEYFFLILNFPVTLFPIFPKIRPTHYLIAFLSYNISIFPNFGLILLI